MHMLAHSRNSKAWGAESTTELVLISYTSTLNMYTYYTIILLRTIKVHALSSGCWLFQSVTINNWVKENQHFMYVCVHMCICVLVCVHMYVYTCGSQNQHWMSSPNALHLIFYFFEMESLTEPGLTDSAGLASQLILRTCLPPPSPCRDYRHAALTGFFINMGSRNQTQEFMIIKQALTKSLSPHPLDFCF